MWRLGFRHDCWRRKSLERRCGRAIFGNARVHQGTLQANSFLQQCLHLFHLPAGALQFLLDLLEPTAEVNPPQSPHGSFQIFGRELFVFIHQDRRQQPAVGLGWSEVHDVLRSRAGL